MPAEPNEKPKLLPKKAGEQEKPDPETVIEQQHKVILKQGEYISRLESNDKQLRNIIEQQKKQLEHYANPAENLDQEFNLCKEEVYFTDVGGLSPVVSEIRNFQYGMQYPKMYEAYGVKPPRGLLLHGPPGCGKTMMAKAISNELGCFFLEVPVTRFISKWVGEAERTLDAILAKCQDIYKKQGMKVVVCLDEAEQVLRKRGADSTGVMDRCMSVWLRYMDGMVEADGLIYIGLTNRIDMVDEAVKRPGRFDAVIEIPRPDRVGVEEILRKQVEFKERQAKRQIYEITDYGRLADMLYGVQASGADIEFVLRDTSVKQIKRMIEMDADSADWVIEPSETMIFQQQLEETIRNYNPGNRRNESKRIGFGVK